MEHIFPRTDLRQSQELRILLALSGGTLLLYGINRRSWGGGFFSLAGANLLVRGLTGHSLLETLGVTSLTSKGAGASIPYQLGVQVQESVRVNLPAEDVYRFVRDFANLPRFISHLKTVKVQDDMHSQWLFAGPAGSELACDIEVINDIENKLLAWRSVNCPHVEVAGSMRLEEAASRGTIARISLQYLPPAGAVGTAIAKLLGKDPELEVRRDLRRLRQILDSGRRRFAPGKSEESGTAEVSDKGSAENRDVAIGSSTEENEPSEKAKSAGTGS
jgi:uncharacterized membrane protein